MLETLISGQVGEVADKKSNPITGALKSPGFVKELWEQITMVYYLVRDRDVPLYLKALPFLGLLYVLFPIDFITDFVPVLGQIDDLMVVTIGAKVFIELAPAHVVAKYMALMRGEAASTIVDGVASDVEKAVRLIEGEATEVLKDAEKK